MLYSLVSCNDTVRLAKVRTKRLSTRQLNGYSVNQLDGITMWLTGFNGPRPRHHRNGSQLRDLVIGEKTINHPAVVGLKPADETQL